MSAEEQIAFTLRAVCERLDLNYFTVKNWVSRGTCPFRTVKVGDLRMVLAADLDEFVEGLRRSAPVPPEVAPTPTPAVKRGRGRPPKMAA